MRIKTKRRSRKFTVTLIAVAALVIAGVFYYLHHFQLGPFKATRASTSIKSNTGKINYQKPTPDQQSAGSAIKKSVVDQGASSTPSNNSTTIPMSITSVNKSGNYLVIRANIQTISDTGTCTLQMTGPGNYTSTVDVQAMASSSTCKGFNVPLSSLASGTWKATIIFQNGSQTGSATKEGISV